MLATIANGRVRVARSSALPRAERAGTPELNFVVCETTVRRSAGLRCPPPPGGRRGMLATIANDASDE